MNRTAIAFLLTFVAAACGAEEGDETASSEPAVADALCEARGAAADGDATVGVGEPRPEECGP